MATGVAERGRVVDRTFARNGEHSTPRLTWFVDGIANAMADDRYIDVGVPGPEVQVVLHQLDAEDPRPYRRKNAPTFVVAIGALDQPPTDLLRTGYPLLVRGLANLAVLLSDGPSGPVASFVTLELGTYTVDHEGDDGKFFAAVVERIEPLASSRLVIANEFFPDLTPDLWNGDEQTALAAYNAGQTNVDAWLESGGGIRFAETRHYVDSVEKAKKVYRRAYRSELGLG